MKTLKLILLAVTALVPTLSFAGNPCEDMDPVACQTFSLTNVERVKYNLQPFNYSHVCYQMAQEQSNDMDVHHYFSHQRPPTTSMPGEDFGHRAVRFGLQMGVGENIAMAQSAQDAVTRWMNSPGHRANILNPRFHSLGVGYKNGLYTQDFSNQ